MDTENNRKIAFITPLYLPAPLSGSGRVVQGLAEGLAKEGYDCTVITSRALNTRWWYDPFFGRSLKENKTIINQVKILRLDCKHLNSLVALLGTRYGKNILPQRIYQMLRFKHCGPILDGLYEILAREGFDLIYSSPFPAYLNKQVAQILPILSNRPRWILGPYFHAELFEYHNPQLRSVLIDADKIHIATRAEKSQIDEIFKIKSRRYIFIPHFLELEKLTEVDKLEEDVKEFRQRYELEDKYIILFAGGKIELKGVFVLFKAIRELAEVDARYCLVTLGNSTSRWDRLVQQLRPRFLVDLGWVSEREKEIAFAACDLYCMPSICESFGLTYLEAWHKKKPVIGADIPPVRELVNGAKGGILVKFGETKLLANAINRLRKQQRLARQLGKNGYRALQKYYTRKKVIQQFGRLFINFG